MQISLITSHDGAAVKDRLHPAVYSRIHEIDQKNFDLFYQKLKKKTTNIVNYSYFSFLRALQVTEISQDP